MSKFKVEVEVQGYKVELGRVKFSVEGTKEDAPRIAQQIERQLSGMVQAPAVMAPTALAPGNGNAAPPVIDGEIRTDDAGSTKRKPAGKRQSGGGAKTAPDSLNLSLDPATHGSPTQAWTTAEKSIWFLYGSNS
jgi:hypothetical protein